MYLPDVGNVYNSFIRILCPVWVKHTRRENTTRTVSIQTISLPRTLPHSYCVLFDIRRADVSHAFVVSFSGTRATFLFGLSIFGGRRTARMKTTPLFRPNRFKQTVNQTLLLSRFVEISSFQPALFPTPTHNVQIDSDGL